MLSSKRQYFSARQLGFTLVEVLVSMVLLSIGALGFMSLITVGFSGNYLSGQRTQGNILVYTIEEKMRANMQAVRDNDFSSVDTSTLTTAPSVLCMNNPCTAKQMADADIWLWRTEIARLLPNGVGTIVCADSDVGDADNCTDAGKSTSPHRITITWSKDAISKDFKR